MKEDINAEWIEEMIARKKKEYEIQKKMEEVKDLEEEKI